MRVVVLVPRRSDGGRRDALWAWVKARWETDKPEYEVFEGHHDDGPFNRSLAINRAAAAAGEFDVAIVADSDSFVGWHQLDAGIARAVETGQLTLPYVFFSYLGRKMSAQVMAGFDGVWQAEWSLPGTCSSTVIVPRVLWDRVGGFDEGFVGWGMEDVAFKLACDAMGGGSQRIDTDDNGWATHVWHLFHGPSRENAPTPEYLANIARLERYRECDYDPALTAALLVELGVTPPRIPARLIRTVASSTSDEVEAFWDTARNLHPDWDHLTFRDPIDTMLFPLTSPYWDRCESGAQLAGLIRLEALFNLGGIYIDSDVELFRPLDPLLTLEAFAAWEDADVVPDAVMGAAAGHPAILECLRLAIERIENGPPAEVDWRTGNGAWSTGPGVTTTILPNRPDVTLLPPVSFYPYHYTEKDRRHEDFTAVPGCFGAHHWAASWLP